VAHINFDKLANNLKTKIDSAQKDSIVKLEEALKGIKTPEKSVPVLTALSTVWENAKYLELAAHYSLKVAKLDSTAKNWQRAGNKLAQALQISTDSSMRAYLLPNALQALENSYQFDTTSVEAKVSLGGLYVEVFQQEPQQLMKGIFMLREVAEQDTTNFKANLILGRMSIMSGQFDKAVARLKRAIQVSPTTTEVYFYLADAYLGLNDKENAIKALKDCKKSINNPKFASTLDEYIAKIKNN